MRLLDLKKNCQFYVMKNKDLDFYNFFKLKLKNEDYKGIRRELPVKKKLTIKKLKIKNWTFFNDLLQ